MKYKYFVLHDFTRYELDKMGDKGWELVSVTYKPQTGVSTAYLKLQIL